MIWTVTAATVSDSTVSHGAVCHGRMFLYQGIAIFLLSSELAVGAPYGEGLPGTVFIYSGGKGNPIPVLSQTIVGSELNLERALLDGLTSFGAFVEGNTDIDGNCYNGESAVLLPTMEWWGDRNGSSLLFLQI